MSDSNIIAIVSIVAGASVAIMSAWFQYRGARMAQRQDRLLSYENRVGERRISTYLDVLGVVLPIKRWTQEYSAGQMAAPPALEVDQELLVNLAAFGSADMNDKMAVLTRRLRSLSGPVGKFAPVFDKVAGKLEEFEAVLARSEPDTYTAWMTIKSTLSNMVEAINVDISY